MKIKEITGYLEDLAPLASQESYDNCGLIIGNPDADVSGVLVSLDCIEESVDEAIRLGVNLLISHHPIVFKGLKKLNGKNYVERTVIKAIKHNIALYAMHTNLDNYFYGVNREIGERLGLKNLRILAPKQAVLTKLVVFVPVKDVERVADTMFQVGAGRIGNYNECSFRSAGTGTFRPVDEANPVVGSLGELSREDEFRLEVLVSNHHLNKVVAAMKLAHPYEEVAYEMYSILNKNQDEGAGMVGELETAVDEHTFLNTVKEIFNCGIIRHTKLKGEEVKRVAFCGGSGSFLLNDAKSVQADVFITGDFKYHEFFDAENQIVIADIGHYESEQFTSNRIQDLLTKNFPNLQVLLSEINTNPINYF